MAGTEFDTQNFKIKASFDRAAAEHSTSTGDRTVPVSISSDTPIKQWDGSYLILDHGKKAIDLSRAEGGLPLLIGHRRDDLPIGVVDEVRSDGHKLRGVMRLGSNDRNDAIWSDIQSGILKDMSIAGEVIKTEEVDEHTTRATYWRLDEASLVAVPADSSVGINRSKPQGNDMSDKTDQGTDSAQNQQQVVDFSTAIHRGFSDGSKAGRDEAYQAVLEIEKLFSRFAADPGAEALRVSCIERKLGLNEARGELLDYLGGLDGNAPVGLPPKQQSDQVTRRGDSATGGETDREKFITGATNALMIRAGLASDELKKQEEGTNEFLSYSMVELCRKSLERNGFRITGDRRAVVGQALTRASMGVGTPDLPAILENVAGKAAQIGYNKANETWSQIARAVPLADFKVNTRVQQSDFPDLLEVGENGQFKYAGISDFKENIQLKTYGRLFSITRQAIINDDQQILDVPRAMGAAAARTVGDVVYGVLTANAAMTQDATAIFAAGHSNFVDNGSGAAPSVATVDAGRVAMALQTGPQGATLNIRPAILLVPVTLEGTARVLMAAEFNPAEGATTSFREPNSVRGIMSVVSDPRLDADDTAAWYMSADPNVFSTLEVGFLQGNQSPVIEQQTGWTVDGSEQKVRIDVAAACLDYRGLYFNDGN